jgi:hypothetical protein
MNRSWARWANTTIKLLASAGVLGGALAFAEPAHALTGLFRVAPAMAPHKTFDLPNGGCPYNAGNTPSSLTLYSHDNTCASGDQRWWVQDMGGGQHEFRQGGSGGKCLDVDNGGAGNGIGTYTCVGTSNQRWWIDEMVSEGPDGLYKQYKLRSVRDNRVIDLQGGTGTAPTANGTRIMMNPDSGDMNQRWLLWANGGMHKDWEDDFNGGSIDTGAWNLANFGAGRFNGELQNYSPSKVQTVNGHLTITANTSGCTGSGCYTSGRISSKGKRWYRNGMFSARIHYYEYGGGNMGTWPAFWILGNNVNEDPVTAGAIGGSCWPTPGAREIDIWEWVRNNNGSTYINNGITGSACNGAAHQTGNPGSWNWNDWIIASVKIDGGRVKFYRNGIKTHDIPDTGLANEDFAFVFNLAVGGALGGDSSGFNATNKWAGIDVDWVAHETW